MWRVEDFMWFHDFPHCFLIHVFTLNDDDWTNYRVQISFLFLTFSKFSVVFCFRFSFFTYFFLRLVVHVRLCVYFQLQNCCRCCLFDCRHTIYVEFIVFVVQALPSDSSDSRTCFYWKLMDCNSYSLCRYFFDLIHCNVYFSLFLFFSFRLHFFIISLRFVFFFSFLKINEIIFSFSFVGILSLCGICQFSALSFTLSVAENYSKNIHTVNYSFNCRWHVSFHVFFFSLVSHSTLGQMISRLDENCRSRENDCYNFDVVFSMACNVHMSRQFSTSFYQLCVFILEIFSHLLSLDAPKKEHGQCNEVIWRQMNGNFCIHFFP